MTLDVQQWLYQLLPAHLRGRDAAEGGPVADLFALIAAQIADLREDLDQRYDDLFIETCAAWVVPYIAELVGHDDASGSRAEVARTLGYRRRKGTAAVLPDLCRDVYGAPVHVVEALDRLAAAQHLDFPRPELAAPDLRAWQPLDRLGGPFSTLPVTADLRSERAHDLSDVRVFVWRKRLRALRGVDAFTEDGRTFFCDPLGRDNPLWSRPADVEGSTSVPEQVPAPITRRELHERLPVYYGPGRSISIRVDGVPVTIDRIAVADLSGARAVRTGRVALDPALGRIRLPQPAARVEVDCFTGALAELGGGQGLRDRQTSGAPDRVVKRGGDTLDQALAAVALQPGATRIVEIQDSGTYTLAPAAITVPAGARLIVRAAARERPLVRLGGDVPLRGDGTVELDGLCLAGGALLVETSDLRLVLRDTTLVPGQALQPGGLPRFDGPSLVLRRGAALDATRSVLGPVHSEPTARLGLRGSIVDAGALTRPALIAPYYPIGSDTRGLPALPDAFMPGGALDLDACTVVGHVSATTLDAVHSIFHAVPRNIQVTVAVARRQTGLLRSCYVPADALVPRRERPVPPGLAPAFVSLRFGSPGYAELARNCPPEIAAGAADESELGAFHDLFLPRRERALRARLDEYLRLGLRAGVQFVT